MSRQVDRPPVPRDTPFAAELETLTPWVRPTVLALLRGLSPHEVARELGVSSNYVQCARHQAVKTLGPESPLVAALPRREIKRRPAQPKGPVNFVEPASVSLRTSPAPRMATGTSPRSTTAVGAGPTRSTATLTASWSSTFWPRRATPTN